MLQTTAKNKSNQHRKNQTEKKKKWNRMNDNKIFMNVCEKEMIQYSSYGDLQSKTTGLHNHQRIKWTKKKKISCMKWREKIYNWVATYHVSDFLWTQMKKKKITSKAQLSTVSMELNKSRKNIVITNLYCLYAWI